MGDIVNLFSKAANKTDVPEEPIEGDGTKQVVFEKLASQGPVSVMLDPRKPNVIVPASLIQNPGLILNFSFRFKPLDLTWDEKGIRETLSFSRAPFCVSIPWAAIYRMNGILWAQEVPPELTVGTNVPEKAPKTDWAEEAYPRRRDGLSPKQVVELRGQVEGPKLPICCCGERAISSDCPLHGFKGGA